jgi:cullin 1
MLRREQEQRDDLARVYRLFSRIDGGLTPIAQIVREHIEKVGDDTVEKRRETIAGGDGEGGGDGDGGASAGGGSSSGGGSKRRAVVDDPYDTTFVRDLLELHRNYAGLVRVTFQDDALFQRAMKDAFERFVNKDVGENTNAKVSVLLCTVTFHANHAHNLTRSP